MSAETSNLASQCRRLTRIHALRVGVRPLYNLCVFASDYYIRRHGLVFPGDQKPALDAPFGELFGLAIGPDGNPAVLDRENCIAARIANGVLSVLAGNGLCIFGQSGVGGPAVNGMISVPLSIAYDAQALYILTATAVYKVAQGAITRIAGDDRSAGFAGATVPRLGPCSMGRADSVVVDK